MSVATRLLEHSLGYRVWQAPFAERKMAPIHAYNDLSRVKRVLDVGCGPGTNAGHFVHTEYLGIDLNDRYVEHARRRYNRTFITADVRHYRVPAQERFDFILVNSLLHHLDTLSTRLLLRHLAELLSDDGYIHILDLVMPERRSVARLLAEWDRGEFPRPLDSWRLLFSESFDAVAFEPYPLGAFGITMWNMVYFKGRRQQ